MPTNTGEAREIKDRATANEAEVVRESKTLARKVKADLKKQEKGQAAATGENSKSDRRTS